MRIKTVSYTHLLLTKADHESRYQRLFLMTTGLKTEIYLMHKNTEEIERVMSNAYTVSYTHLDSDDARRMALRFRIHGRHLHGREKPLY